MNETSDSRNLLPLWPIVLAACLALTCLIDAAMAYVRYAPPVIGNRVVHTCVFLGLALGITYTVCAFSQRMERSSQSRHFVDGSAFAFILLILAVILARAYATFSPAIGLAWLIVVALWFAWCPIRITAFLAAKSVLRSLPPIGMGLAVGGTALFASCIVGGCQSGYEAYRDDRFYVVLNEPIFGRNFFTVYESRPFGRMLKTQYTSYYSEDLFEGMSEDEIRGHLDLYQPIG